MANYCSSCGKRVDPYATFCQNCGEVLKATPRPNTVNANSPAVKLQQKVNSNTGLTPYADGKYRWCYELNLFTNPTALITCLKVFGGVILGCGLFIGLISQQEFLDMVKFILILWTGGFGGLLVIGGISYLIYAALQGGKYCVVFEMDKKTITHIQLAKQFKKAQAVATLTSLMGAATGSATLVGTGLLAGSRASMQTSFEIVNKIKVSRRRKVIYLHESFSWNQVYVSSENFDTVLNFILSRIPSTAKRKGI